MFKILGNAWPVFAPLFAFKPFVWFMSKVYAFISYNRRVIIPPVHEDAYFAFKPGFKLHYRIAFLLFTWFGAAFILTRYAHLLVGMVPLGNAYREYLICGGQIIVQAIVICLYAKEKVWAYLGNMMTISFAGSLLLLIQMAVNQWFPLSPFISTLCFMCTAGLMFLEHVRRTKLLQLGWVMTISWVSYRIVLLILILN